MASKLQATNLNRTFGQAVIRLENWAINPWRRYSLFLIVLLTGFLFGSAIGTINGVLALMDPVGAFFTVLILEFMVRLRRNWNFSKKGSLIISIVDLTRIGLLYGLLMEGFKLL